MSLAIPAARWDDNRVFVDEYVGPQFDIVAALQALHPLPGRVLLAMDPPRERRGTLMLGLEAENNSRSDVGTVLVSGVEDMSPGERFCVLPASGKRFARVHYHGFEHTGTLLWIGIDSMSDDVVERPIEETVVMKLAAEGMEPYRDWVFIRRNARVGKVGELYLPDEVRFRDSTARIVAKGPGADAAVQFEIEVGADYIYRQAGLLVDVDIEDFKAYGYEGDLADYAFIRAGNLYSKVILP